MTLRVKRKLHELCMDLSLRKTYIAMYTNLSLNLHLKDFSEKRFTLVTTWNALVIHGAYTYCSVQKKTMLQFHRNHLGLQQLCSTNKTFIALKLVSFREGFQ